MFKHVCIIDDDEVSTFLTYEMLIAERFAQKYETFLNPSEALNCLLPRLQQKQLDGLPDVIFLDLNMPYMDGWKFLDNLAPFASQLKSCCRIYILTSSVDMLEIKRAQGYDFLSGFLQKPLEDKMIKRILERP
ncbi:response regulator [Pontibacter litorisediminis]|uniref:response regulator n=1 Tax=Pontibacter litorisediminis TaxID=1846260 RepID=UPI0023EB1140|nr:response regulator [Pontibacter litorisediminis]